MCSFLKGTRRKTSKLHKYLFYTKEKVGLITKDLLFNFLDKHENLLQFRYSRFFAYYHFIAYYTENGIDSLHFFASLDSG